MSQVDAAGGNDAAADVSSQTTQEAAPDASVAGGADAVKGSDDSGSLLTREDGEAGDTADAKPGEQDAGKEGQDKAKEGDAKKDVDPATVVPAKPEDYALKFADEANVDKALLDNFKKAAHEIGIPQGQAQKLADFYAKNVADSAKAAQEAQVASLMEAKKGWESEITARPGFKTEVVDAKRTLKEFGTPELNELMDTSLLGSHPVFFDFVVKVGKALAEPEVRGRGTGGVKDLPLDQRLWPEMK